MAMGAIEMCRPNCDLPWCKDAPKHLASLSTKVWQVWLLPFRHQVVVGAIHPPGTNSPALACPASQQKQGSQRRVFSGCRVI